MGTAILKYVEDPTIPSDILVCTNLKNLFQLSVYCVNARILNRSSLTILLEFELAE
jgi:hypothetical protein